MAEALSRFAPAEQRRRSVVLHVQDDRPTREELIREIEEKNARESEGAVERPEQRLKDLLEREQAAKKLLATPPPVKRSQLVEQAPAEVHEGECEAPDDES